MTRADELRALIARVESAGVGEQYSILHAVWEYRYGKSAERGDWLADDAETQAADFYRSVNASAYTDAALSMVPEGWTGLPPIQAGDYAWLLPEDVARHSGFRCRAATPALALCAAILKIELEKCDAD